MGWFLKSKSVKESRNVLRLCGGDYVNFELTMEVRIWEWKTIWETKWNFLYSCCLVLICICMAPHLETAQNWGLWIWTWVVCMDKEAQWPYIHKIQLGSVYVTLCVKPAHAYRSKQIKPSKHQQNRISIGFFPFFFFWQNNVEFGGNSISLGETISAWNPILLESTPKIKQKSESI